MLEEQTNEVPVDQTLGESESSTNETGESQDTTNVNTQDAVEKTTTESSESDNHDTLEQGNEGVEVKESADMSDREKSAVRKMHEATQEGAKYKKEADAFQELLNHPEFNEFLQWQKENKQNPAQPKQESPQVELTEEELLAAQTDPAKYESLMTNKFQQMLKPLADQVLGRLNNMERDNAISKQERVLDAFAEKNPDFYKIDPRIMKAAIADTRGQGIEAAYQMAKSLESKYLDKAQSSIQAKVNQKKKASSASPSKPMEAKIVYAATQAEADHIAFENARLGKRVDVRVKK